MICSFILKMASVYWRRSTVPARVAFLNTSYRFIRFLRNDLSIISRLISCHSWNFPLLSIPTLYTHHAKNLTGLWAGQGVLTVHSAWNALPPNIYIASSAQMFSLKCHLIREGFPDQLLSWCMPRTALSLSALSFSIVSTALSIIWHDTCSVVVLLRVFPSIW